MIFGPLDAPMPEVDISDQRMSQMLGDIKRNSRNRRIALVAPLVLAAAVVGAMIAAPPQHGGLAMVADAEAPDPQLPRVFGSNGVWRLAEPIEDGPVTDSGPASIVQAPAAPDAPDFELAPPDQEDLNSLPTSTSTPPTSTSGQLPADPAEVDLSTFGAEIRIEPAIEEAATEPAGTEPSAADAADASAAIETEDAEPADSEAELVEPGIQDATQQSTQAEAPAVAEVDGLPDDTDVADPDVADTDTDVAAAFEPADATTSQDPVVLAEPGQDDTTPEDNQASDDVTVAVQPQIESADSAEANPSTPAADLNPAEVAPFSTPATITPQSVLVYSAHVSVTVLVVDDDSSVIDWCNTRVDWGDGSVTRVAGADDAALCTASCEYEATSSASSNDATESRSAAAGINVSMQFEHDYTATIDASPRIFVATGDGCSYTLAELELAPFTVVPLP